MKLHDDRLRGAVITEQFRVLVDQILYQHLHDMIRAQLIPVKYCTV
jgi:hypothetical protein